MRTAKRFEGIPAEQKSSGVKSEGRYLTLSHDQLSKTSNQRAANPVKPRKPDPLLDLRVVSKVVRV